MSIRVENVDTTEIAAFLRRFSPFDALPRDELGAVAGAAELRHYTTGENVLVEDAQPAQHLFVVHEGSVELVHEGEVVDILEPGESFGHPSLLTGLAPAFTVRAHEEGTSCFLIPREAAMRALASPAGTSFVAATLRERLTRTGHTVHALPPVNTLSVGDLVRRPPVFCTGDVTIHKAARLMTENGVSAILIRDGRSISIVTDAQLREHVIAEEFSAGNPVMRVAATAVTVRPDYLAVDAVVEMLDAGTDHVVVTRDGEAIGLLSAADLLGLESRSPFALRHALLRAHDEDELVETAKDLRHLLLALVEADLPPEKIGRVLSLQLDTITARLIDFAIARHGLAPVPWAWLQLGSAARREFTLGSDQENALAYADSEDGATHDAYFERFADEVDEGLARCGFPPDANDVLARNRLWRMSQSEWLRVFGECLESPDESHLIRATVAFDFRHAGGGLEIVPPLVAVLRRAPEFPDFVRQLARSATAFKPPLGFRGSLPGGRKSDDRRIDIKRGGAIPIANLARFYALTNGVTISATLDRLVAAQETGALDAETATGLREAFGVVSRCRLLHHARQIEAGVPPDNLIDPADLLPLGRIELREAFRVIVHAQKGLGAYVPLGL
jgi:CBS domain-containing protein